jgi:undecaprenyl-diphosphatase
MYLVTQAGSPASMTAIALIALALLLWKRRHTLAVGWMAAFAGGGLLDQVLKMAVRRDRPIYGTHFLHGHTYSFPSGHAMGSLIGFGMLAYLIIAFRHPRRTMRVAIYVLAGVLALLVGASRIYLGVHYPSDVLGGFAAGGAWLAICITGVGIARRRREGRNLDEQGRHPLHKEIMR